MKPTHTQTAVTALETAMAALSAAHQRIQQSSHRATGIIDSVDPVRWTPKIEAAIGNPEELERLRVLYDEKALTAMSSWLSDQMAWHHVSESNKLVGNAIRDVLVAYDAIEPRSPDQWLKQIMQTRCVEASQLHATKLPDTRIDDRNAIFTRAYGILVQSFTVLAKRISVEGARRFYPTDLVVPGRKYESFLDASVDLRGLYMVEFIDCVNSKHPACAKLAELMNQMEALLQAAHLAENRLKGGQNQFDIDCSKINNGTINERQHANRLMDALHGQPYSGGPSQRQLADQNERRWRYEAVRQEVLIANQKLIAMHEDLAETLHAAVLESQQLLKEVQEDRYTTVDRWQTVRICMNNCLTVDLHLRSIGRFVQDMDNLYRKDYSQGAGLQALAVSFAEVEKRYRPIEWPSQSKTPAKEGPAVVPGK